MGRQIEAVEAHAPGPSPRSLSGGRKITGVVGILVAVLSLCTFLLLFVLIPVGSYP